MCKGDLSGGKTLCQDSRQDKLQALPAHDAVKGEIPAGTTLGDLQSLILLSASQLLREIFLLSAYGAELEV